MKRLALKKISVTFGQVKALVDVDLEVEAGRVIGLAGPNGSGKSTLIRVLLGLVRPKGGQLLVDGDVRSVDSRFKRELGYLPESVAFSESVSGRQVLRFFASARGVKRKRVDAVLERVGLEAAAKRAVRGYSRGMRQRLGLGVAILAEPQLLILDEPTGGLDQQGLVVLREIISEWREAGRMALVATHDLALMEARLDRICLLQDGAVVCDDTPAKLREIAAMPVQVTFEVDKTEEDAVTVFVEALEKWGRCESLRRQNGQVFADVAPHELLDLVDLRREHERAVKGLRVRERALDVIYDRLIERLRDRWVLVVSVLFALLSVAVALYGRRVEAGTAQLTGASLVTLASLLVPLVALVLGHDAIVGERERNTLGLLLSLPVSRTEVTIAKFLGRLVALGVALSLGLGVAIAAAPVGGRAALTALIGPSLMLGASFLAIGVLVSSIAKRQIGAASAVVAIWFFMVILFDLGLLGLMVISDGAVSSQTIATLMTANPVGLFRVQLLQYFGGGTALSDLGINVPAPGSAAATLLWSAWIIVPVLLSGLLLRYRSAYR